MRNWILKIMGWVPVIDRLPAKGKLVKIKNGNYQSSGYYAPNNIWRDVRENAMSLSTEGVHVEYWREY